MSWVHILMWLALALFLVGVVLHLVGEAQRRKYQPPPKRHGPRFR